MDLNISSKMQNFTTIFLWPMQHANVHSVAGTHTLHNNTILNNDGGRIHYNTRSMSSFWNLNYSQMSTSTES